MQLNIDCQVTDETIVSLKRHNDELRQRLGHEIDQGHQLDRTVRALEADLAHVEREEQSCAAMCKDATDTTAANASLHAHLAALRTQNDMVLD